VEAGVKELLREALAQTGKPTGVSVQHDLDGLAGTWSDEAANEFLAATKDLGRVDEDLWK